MSLGSELAAVAARVSSPSFPLASEEAVKQSLVLPALSALGYETVGLSDITPEYPVGGARVDYALLSGGSPVCLSNASGNWVQAALGNCGAICLRRVSTSEC